MITRLPVATAEDHHNLFMAIDGVAGGMQDADAPLLAGSVGGIRRGMLITHPGHSGWRTRRPARSASGACGSPRILTDPYEFGLVAAGKSDLGRSRPRSVSGVEIGRRFDIEVPIP